MAAPMKARWVLGVGVAVLAGWLLPGARIAQGDDPAYYVKKGSWQETVRLSRDALVHQEEIARQQAAQAARGEFQPFSTEMTRAQAPRHVKVRVAGLKTLYLGATAQDGSDWGYFADPVLIDGRGQATPLVAQRPMLARTRGGIRSDQERGWRPIRIADREFARGCGFQRSEAAFDLAGRYEWFEAWICVPGDPKDRRLRFWVDQQSRLEGKSATQEDRRRIWDLAARDFPDLPFDHERDLEAHARVWDADWPEGDVSQLAGRYASACPAPLRAKASSLATSARTAPDLAAVRGLYYLARARDRLALARKTLELVESRRAGTRPKLAAALADLAGRIEQDPDPRGADLPGLYHDVRALRRSIILSHPALSFEKLLINKRTRDLPEHMCDQYLGRHSRPGPGLAVLESWKDRPREKLLLTGKLPPGAVLHPDLSFDATRAVFSFCDDSVRDSRQRAYFLYEVALEDGKVRQITGTPADPMLGAKGRRTVLIEDLDPCYLPDGGFAFISTRSQQFGRCHGGRYVPAYVLYRVEADGSNIRQLSFNEANEWDPSVLHDGRIVYTRWDYINRHDTNFQSLWVIRPDGTGTEHFYGNYSVGPCMIAEARAIPGSHKVVATATDHHGYTAGSIIVIDPCVGQDGGEPLTAVTPELSFPERGAPRGTTMAPGPLPDDISPPDSRLPARRDRAATPLPVTEDIFLVAFAYKSQYAIFLIDTLGGRELIYYDPNVSCFAPIPVRPSPRPPVMPSLLAAGHPGQGGRFFVRDVYQSTQPIERGTIKRLRVSEIISQPTRSKPILSYVDNEIIKRILGTVPVAPDGSVALEAPSGKPLQFQLLDANGMAVMTMRSVVYLQPGETAACVGCHEPRNSSPVSQGRLHGVEFLKLQPPAGPRYEGGFSFARGVQPVLDRYCIGCHGLDKTEGGMSLLGTPGGEGRGGRHASQFNTAYHTLMNRGGMVRIAQRNSETNFSKPKDYFAHAGRLGPMLLEGHKDKQGKPRVQLDRDSFQRIIDWLDLNAQYHGDYSFNRIEDQNPDLQGQNALREYIRRRFGEELSRQPYAALVNAALPGESRILKAPLPASAGGWGQIASNAWPGPDDPAYGKMLRLIEASIAPPAFHDIAGTCGRDHCACGMCWVRKLMEARAAGPQGPATSNR